MGDKKKVSQALPLENTLQIEQWRQRLQTEQKIAKGRDIQDLERMKAELEQKNSYMNLFKDDNVKRKQEDDEKQKTNFAYDQAKNDMYEDSQYCNKCKYESKWCKHRKLRDDFKQTQSSAVTTSQNYGWRHNYDNLTFGNNRSGICKRTFYDFGHLS